MSQFGETSLITNMIYQRIATPQDHRIDGLIHASSATREKPRFCARAFVLQNMHNIPPKEEIIPPLLRITFDQGNDRQARINNEYLKDVMVGRWKCKICGHRTGVQKAPKQSPCEHGVENYRYVEVSWRAKDSLLVGSTDALVEVSPKDKLVMVELKIISPNDFKELVAPLAEHTFRTQLYLWLIANSTRPEREWVNTKFAYVLYCNRAYGAKIDGRMTAHREFMVGRNDTAIEGVLRRIKAASDGMRDMEPPEGICDTKTCWRAKQCSAADVCFA